MSYKIYELVKPEILKETKPDGFEIKTIELITIKEVNYPCLALSYNSELEARSSIKDNKDNLKDKDLIVLNVMSINWEGKIS